MINTCVHCFVCGSEREPQRSWHCHCSLHLKVFRYSVDFQSMDCHVRALCVESYRQDEGHAHKRWYSGASGFVSPSIYRKRHKCRLSHELEPAVSIKNFLIAKENQVGSAYMWEESLPRCTFKFPSIDLGFPVAFIRVSGPYVVVHTCNVSTLEG